MEVAKPKRLYFIDAMRAWAILMMLQGHFIDGLLDPVYRDAADSGYKTWLYFRGITGPVFFTVSGFIFTYLLIRVPEKGWQNPRVKKGIRRGLQLLFIGYLLRLNFLGLLKGQIYGGFYLVDVLHCIGLSIMSIIGVYLLTQRAPRWVFPTALLGITLLLFTFEPIYKTFTYPFLPEALANYLTKANGSVYTIMPWLGYAAFGGFLSWFFQRYKAFSYLYEMAIPIAAFAGLCLIYFSSAGFAGLSQATGIEVFNSVANYNYLYIRLGDVLVVFAVFMILRKLLTNKTLIAIGQKTLSIYVIHFIILYGSFTGLGLYKFFHHSLSWGLVIPSAIVFMTVCSVAALEYEKRDFLLKNWILKAGAFIWEGAAQGYAAIGRLISMTVRRLTRPFARLKS